MITRQDYMSKKATHREYYGQFVTPGIIRSTVRHIGEDKILASTDEHMNDIRLPCWESMHQFLIPLYAPAMVKATGNKGVSLSDTVCIAKEAARQWIEVQ